MCAKCATVCAEWSAQARPDMLNYHRGQWLAKHCSLHDHVAQIFAQAGLNYRHTFNMMGKGGFAAREYVHPQSCAH